MKRQHPLLVLWRRTRPLFVDRELGLAATFLAAAVVLALVALGFFINYTIETRSVGNVLFDVSLPIPIEQRRRSLRLALFLWALTLLLLIAAVSMFLQYRNSSERREAAHQAARDEYAKQEARRQWLATPGGYAQSILEAGYSEMTLVLRVRPPEHLEALRQVQRVGWVLSDRHDHPEVKYKESTSDGYGGHEVVQSAIQDATFVFVRKMPGS